MKPNKTQFTSSGFIKPDGTFISIPDCGHEDWCEENKLVKDTLVYSKKWIALSRDGGFYYDFPDKARYTQAQIDTLFDWAQALKLKSAHKLFREFLENHKLKE